MIEFLLALLTIIAIDIILGGENALVIALASRNLPQELKRKAIFWGTAGAVLARFLCVLAISILLLVPGLRLLGGLLLIWIAWQLTQDKPHTEVATKETLAGAIGTIVLADITMGLDNSLAIAGAAGGSWALIILGLLISVPIIIWGASWIEGLLARRPWLIYWGAWVLYLVSVKMIVEEPFIHQHLQPLPVWIDYMLELIIATQLAIYQYYRQEIKP